MSVLYIDLDIFAPFLITSRTPLNMDLGPFCRSHSWLKISLTPSRPLESRLSTEALRTNTVIYVVIVDEQRSTPFADR